MNILRFFRILYRAFAILIWTLLFQNLFIDLPRLFSKKRRFPYTVHFWGKGLAWLMGIKIHRLNEIPLPMGEVIISNHLGFLDVPVMSSVFPAVYMIKAEAKKPFYFGPALERNGHFFVDREDSSSMRKAAKDLLKFSKDFCRIIIFPEGKASPDAARLPFKPGAFAMAKKLDKTVQPCVIDYLPDRSVHKWDTKKKGLPQLINYLGKKRIDVSIEFFPAVKIEGDMKEFADKWHDIIENRLKQHDSEKDGNRV
jgi:lyso-ornithine lipid O-acyltransferase